MSIIYKKNKIGLVSLYPTKLYSLIRRIGNLYNFDILRYPELHSNSDVNGWIILSENFENLNHIDNCKLPTLNIINSNDRTNCDKFEILDNSILPAYLKKKQFHLGSYKKFQALPLIFKGDEIIVSANSISLWKIVKNRKTIHHFVANNLPILADSDPLYLLLQNDFFLSSFPIFHFIKSLTTEHLIPSKIKACFIFDDPNLHWHTYGYVNYKKIVTDAIKHNYHVSFATIPIDGWYIHKPVANLFRKYDQYISLLVHGNNHIKRELSRRTNNLETHTTIKQALKRIKKIETAANIKIAKVMAPPHGACHANYLNSMNNLHYEGATISLGSLFKYNRNEKWAYSMGFTPTTNVEGFPVLLRFPFKEDYRSKALMAMYFNQPIILMGHHNDLKTCGNDILNSVADYINSLGVIKWANLSSILSSLYSYTITNNTILVNMHSNKISMKIPDNVNSLKVVHSLSSNPQKQHFILKAKKTINIEPIKIDECISVSPGKPIEIRSYNNFSDFTGKNNLNQLNLYAIIRRQLTELRDRLYPSKDFLLP